MGADLAKGEGLIQAAEAILRMPLGVISHQMEDRNPGRCPGKRTSTQCCWRWLSTSQPKKTTVLSDFSKPNQPSAIFGTVTGWRALHRFKPQGERFDGARCDKGFAFMAMHRLIWPASWLCGVLDALVPASWTGSTDQPAVTG